MMPALPPDAALRWLAAMTPGLRAAALLDADGTAVAGDAAAATKSAANEHHSVTVAGTSLTLVAQVDAAVLPGLLRADAATALAAAEAHRGA